jgi:hypothetical protein
MPRPNRPCILVLLLCSVSLSVTVAAPPKPSSGTPAPAAASAGTPPAKKADPGLPPQQIQAWLHNTADAATTLFAATEDLQRRTDSRRVLPGGAPEKKAPYLRSQVEDLDKQRATLGAEIEKIGDYRAHHAAAWGADAENLFLEIQISEHSIGESLAVLRERLKEQHRWYLLGH